MKPGDQSVMVDWYSFTVPSGDAGNGYEFYKQYIERIEFQLVMACGDEILWALHRLGWIAIRGRRPYSGGYRHPELGMTIWFGGQDTALIELSGVGCQAFRDKFHKGYGDYLSRVMAGTSERATRLDFAVDMYTDTEPAAFVQSGFNNRIKSTGDLRSASGSTYYVGSKKARGRYARVYRWTSPAYEHRSHLLRCEMVALKGYARLHARLAATYGVAYSAQALANYFKWQHGDFQKMAEHNETFNTPIRKTSDASRLAWVRRQVAPAIRDLLRRQVVTADDLWTWFAPSNYQPELFDSDGDLIE